MCIYTACTTLTIKTNLVVNICINDFKQRLCNPENSQTEYKRLVIRKNN